MPGVVVVHLLGNPGTTDHPCTNFDAPGTDYVNTNVANMQTLNSWANAEKAERGLPTYWMIPGPSYHLCTPPYSNNDPDYPGSWSWASTLYKWFAHWQETNMTSGPEANLRNVFGINPPGDWYRESFRFLPYPAAVPVRTQTVNGLPDCRHYTPLGYSLVSEIVRAAIHPQWTLQA
jgi:hypothetical protein